MCNLMKKPPTLSLLLERRYLRQKIPIQCKQMLFEITQIHTLGLTLFYFSRIFFSSNMCLQTQD